ncbi:pyridoxal phosphate-dependent transferase [Fimicolochytrium jonesii]|uniref:pyridoxal phosphate-dependent transferase n=1 Tax=Fimicolochytrium jonesii TaxID=1396493 RepID=UPI0022FDED8D|nr:pyridoxal phosphate-dependent transferase [Fimicolochytrium jonesii]KAI8820389.1 pyridoxal phosphate-dependent transferase [Fimicolochytrium jonesii]
MGKGKRAHFDSSRPPVSSADLLSKVDNYSHDTLYSVLDDASIEDLLLHEVAAAPAADPGTPVFNSKGHKTSEKKNVATAAVGKFDDIFAHEKSPSDAHASEHLLEETPYGVLMTTYMSYFFLIIFGHIRDFFGMRFRKEEYAHLSTRDGFAALNSGFDTFYQRRLYRRIRDVFNRPITNVPGRTVTLLERTSDDFNKTFKLTGNTNEVLNLSSYNYLGFAQAEGPCADEVETTIRKYGVGASSSRNEAGTSDLHIETEALVARFVGHEAAMLVSMGFATNSTTIPALVSKGCLIISDELNHASLIYGCRISGAPIKTFKHNDPQDLEKVLRQAIAQGQPRTHRPWKKILVIVEGLYSMEGSICNLPGIVALKKKYKFYLYVDEAHSIGALGPNGRGVCDYFGIDPLDIDILMGTFTKSFGAAGGYICSSRAIIDIIRLHSFSSVYAESITPPILQQIHTSMRIIAGDAHAPEGRRRVAQLARNARFFSAQLRKMGFIVYGDADSPVVPLLLFHPAKIPAFSRAMLERGIAVVVVGYPATPIITSRVRFCLSAAHTIEDLVYALKMISEVGDEMVLKVSRVNQGQQPHRLLLEE